MMKRFVIKMTLPMLEKARRGPRLVPVKKMITRDGKTFQTTVWMLPEDIKAGRTGGAQGSLFDDIGPAPVIQGDLFDQIPDEPKAKPQDVSGVRMAEGGFPRDILRDGEKIGKITEARLNGKVVSYNVRNLQGTLVGSGKTPESALEQFKGGIKKEEPTEPDKPKSEEFTFAANGDTKTARITIEDRKTISGGTKQVKVISVYGSKNKESPEWTKQVEKDEPVSHSWVEHLHKKYGKQEQEKKSPKDMTRDEFMAAFNKDVDFPLQGITPKVEKRAMELLVNDIPSLKGKDIRYAQEKMYQDLDGWGSAIYEAWQEVSLPVGSTKTENGVTYRLNENHRWERVDTEGDDKISKILKDWKEHPSLTLKPSDIAKDYGTSPAWIKKQFDAMVEEGKLVGHKNTTTFSTKYALPGTDGAKEIEKEKADIERKQDEVDRIAEKLRNPKKNSDEEGKKPSGPSEVSSDYQAMKGRVSVEKYSVKRKGITYTFDAIMKDGEPVGKLSEVWVGSGNKQWYVAPLQEKKRRSVFEPFQELVPPCSTKEDAVEKMTMRLFNEEQEAIARKAESEKRAKMIRESKRQSAISNATPSTRTEVANAIYSGEDEIQSIQKDYTFTPKDSTIEFGGEVVSVKDYSDAIPKNIVLVNKKDILTKERPSYIPLVSDSAYDRMEYRIEGVKLGPDRYLVATDRPAYRHGSMLDKTANKYAVVNLTVLVAMQDYYYKRAKAKKADDVDKAKKEGDNVVSVIREMAKKGRTVGVIEEMTEFKDLPNFAKEQYERMASSVYKTWEQNSKRNPGFTIETQIGYFIDSIDRGAKAKLRMKTIAKDRATTAHLQLIQKAKSLSSQRDTWPSFREYLKDLNQGSSDMELQMEENESAYQKGRETSYGRKGSLTYLQDSHGVLVKRQNGDEMTAFEVDEVKKALDSVYSVFGDRSELARNSKLLISHSGEKRMHASKFLGIYIPGRSAIGVTWGMGTKEAGFTLSHEFAHFMDNKIGVKSGRYHFASDDPTSIEHEIASTFRDSMKEAQSSDYQNRTCECFARALEQFYVTETGDSDLYHEERNSTGNHPEQEVYMKKVYPLVKRFFAEKGEMLKSIMLWSFA